MSPATDTIEKDLCLISKDREKELLNLVDRAYCQTSTLMSLLPIVHWLREQGEQLDVSDILYLQQRLGGHRDPLVLPFSVARFYDKLLYSRKASRVLEPTGRLGLLGTWLSLNEYVQQMDVVSINADADELISPLDLPSLRLHIGNIANEKEKLSSEYDAIVSILSIGGRLHNWTSCTTDGVEIELKDETSFLIIAEVADLLAEDGMLAFVMPPRFALSKKNHSVRRNLGRLGLHLSALLKFLPGTFSETNLALDLAIIEKVDRGGLFVAEVPEDFKGQDELISRLWKRKEGSTPSQGWLVPDDQFRGLQALEAAERAKKLAIGKGLEDTPFKRAVIEINLPKHHRTDFKRFEEHPNAVYLPEMATTESRKRQEDLPDKLKSYMQLIVDPSVVLPEYLAEMLNTPLGHAIRKTAMTGATVIPRINKSILAESTLYLPPLIEQQRSIEALSSIQRLRSELAEFESQVWEKPRQVSKVIEALSKVNHEERFEEWLESLPFPLASILRSYHAVDQNDKEKYERLLNFFEAFAEFCAIIHLSAFKKSQVHWETQKRKLATVMNEQGFTLEKPTFGLWVAVAGLFAGELRAMLNGKPEYQAIANELYVTADSRPLEILSSKKIVSLIQQANTYRNRWKGHGGGVPPEEAIKRHNILTQDLARFREIVGTVFLQYQLIEPREAKILDGPVFQCRVRRVMGSNPQLEHQTVELTTPAVSGALYLHNPGHDKALKIIPLIQVSDAPQPASYFYNRFEKTEVHLVSYHFTDQSEIVGAGDSVQKLLDDFNPKEKD